MINNLSEMIYNILYTYQLSPCHFSQFFLYLTWNTLHLYSLWKDDFHQYKWQKDNVENKNNL
jgi:hypothetical protein